MIKTCYKNGKIPGVLLHSNITDKCNTKFVIKSQKRQVEREITNTNERSR